MNKNVLKLLSFVWFCILCACQNNKFKFDPSKPYPELEVGQRWDDKFDSRDLQNGIVKGNYLFVNTINISEGRNYLYCLNKITKKVQWKNEVDYYASKPICISNTQVFYVSYVGNIYSFSLDGKKLWSIKPRIDFKDYKLNVENNNLLVTDVNHEVFEFDKASGKEVKHYTEVYK